MTTFNMTEREIVAFVKDSTVTKESVTGRTDTHTIYINSLSVKSSNHRLNVNYTLSIDKESNIETLSIKKATVVLYEFSKGSKTYKLDDESKELAYKVLKEAYSERKETECQNKARLFSEWKNKYCK